MGWVVVALLLGFAIHGPSLAQEIAGRQGTLSATSYSSVPDQARIAVEFRDDTE